MDEQALALLGRDTCCAIQNMLDDHGQGGSSQELSNFNSASTAVRKVTDDSYEALCGMLATIDPNKRYYGEL